MKSVRDISLLRLMHSILACLGILILCNACAWGDKNTMSVPELTTVMDSIKSQFIPDRRLQIFDFEISNDASKITGRSSNQLAYDQVLELKERFPEINLDSFNYVTPIGTGLINVSVGNIRSNPRHSAELSTQVLMGLEVTIWDQEGYWYYVQTPDEYLGWIDGGGLIVTEKADLQRYQQSEKVMYMKDFGFCYEGPDMESPIVSDLVAGDILQHIGESGNYLHIELPDGRQGFIANNESQDLEEISKAEIPTWPQIKHTAYQFMGRPYLWGGTSGKGVDCSGFTKMVYYLNGLELPRDASQQVRSGVEVPLDDELSFLEPGDLLFFGYKGENGKKDRVTHVGIHIGNGRMIHSSQRVQIQSLMPQDSDYAADRRKTLLTAKRMIDGNTLAQGVTPIKNDPAYGF